MRYEVEIRNRPSTPYNIKHWQMFKDVEKIKRFLEVVRDFSNLKIDQEEEVESVAKEGIDDELL